MLRLELVRRMVVIVVVLHAGDRVVLRVVVVVQQGGVHHPGLPPLSLLLGPDPPLGLRLPLLDKEIEK